MYACVDIFVFFNLKDMRFRVGFPGSRISFFFFSLNLDNCMNEIILWYFSIINFFVIIVQFVRTKHCGCYSYGSNLQLNVLKNSFPNHGFGCLFSQAH